MARKIATISGLISLCLLCGTFGCSKKSATSSNFADGLNHYFQANPECLGSVTFPYTLDFETPDLDGMVGVGLLSKTVGPPHMFASKTYRYDLTPAGHAAASAKNPSAPCYGIKKVEKILNFTEPGDEGVGGSKESSVTFIWKLTNVPAWAHDLAAGTHWSHTDFAAEVKPDAPEDKRKGKAVVVLTHLGWRVEAIDGQPVKDDE